MGRSRGWLLSWSTACGAITVATTPRRRLWRWTLLTHRYLVMVLGVLVLA